MIFVGAAATQPGVPVASQASASIRATAHVEPSLGLTDAISLNSEYLDLPASIQADGNLFWLYSVEPSGVMVEVEELKPGTTSRIDSGGLEILDEHCYTSLVRVGALSGDRAEAGKITITVICTDN